jgi:two-component system, response regulator PdtaR
MVPASLTPGEAPQRDPVILIVEDDVLIRAAAAQYLRGTGFDVVEAVDVDEAVTILRATKDVRVAFTDVKLAGAGTGFDLLEIIKRDFPQVKVLFTSGVVKHDDVARTGVPFIRKPYFLFEIERHIKSLLTPG